MKLKLLLLCILMSTTLCFADLQPSDYEQISNTIISSLKLHSGERVLIRFDPSYMSQLVPHLRKRIRDAGAVDVGALAYVEQELIGVPETNAARMKLSQAQGAAFSKILEEVDVYLWLAASADRDLYPVEEEALRNWLKKGARRRQIHFHWGSGSMMPDGLPGEHPDDMDAIYVKAISIDYDALSAAQDRAIKKLRSGVVRVRTPVGTDLKFEVANRPFNKQNGDASMERAMAARVLVDREIEFPAGVLRVAPIETSVQGKIVIPLARFGAQSVKNLQLDFVNGKIAEMDADENLFEVEAQFAEVGEVSKKFREFGLGFNPQLKKNPESDLIPYYGYGAGVVRLALGDNQEIGGIIQGGFVRWFFFPDATVEVNGVTLVDNGELIDMN